MRQAKKRLIGAIILVVFMLSIPFNSLADPLSASANLNYNATETDSDSNWNLNQSYNLSLSRDLTSALTLSGDLRHNRNSASDAAAGNQTSPTLNLSLRNDLFSSSLGATASRLVYEDQPTRDTWSWNFSSFSQWEDKWPAVRLFYNETYSQDDADEQDEKSSMFGSGFNYQWNFLECSYDYRLSENWDKINDESSRSQAHHATLELQKSWNFFDQRLTTGISQRLTYDYNTSTSYVGAGNEYFLPANQVDTFYALDSSPDDGVLPLYPALTDHSFQASAGIDIANPIEYHNLGFRARDRQVNRIKIFFNRELSLKEQLRLSYRLYLSDDGDEWLPSTAVVRVSYEFLPATVQTVAIIDLDTAVADFGKLLLRTDQVFFDPVSICELEVGERRIAQTDKVTNDYQNWLSDSSLSLSLRPRENWTISANLRYQEEHRRDNDGFDDIEIDLNGSLTSDYYFSHWFWLTLGYSENHNQQKPGRPEAGDEEENSRSYNAALKSAPLETLDLALIYTHSESDESREQSDQNENDTSPEDSGASDSLSFSLAAQLYPDVSADFSSNWNRNDDSSDFNWRFDLTARMTEKLNLDTYCDNLDTYGAQLSWRPSDIMSLSTNIDRDDPGETLLAGAHLAMVWTDTLRSSFSYQYTDSPDTTDHSISFNGNWVPSRLISLTTNCRLLQSAANGSSLNWGCYLSLRY